MAIERGLDFSGYQSPTSSAILTMLGNPLYTFVIVKATEGVGLDIERYPLHRANNYKYGKRHAAYHFAWLNQDPVSEAQHFYRYAALRPGEIGCLDIEDWGETDPTRTNYVRDKAMRDATTWPQRVEYVLRWLREWKRLTGAMAPVYMNWTYVKGLRTNSTTAEWAELCTYVAWLADYDSAAPGVFPTINPKVTGGPTMTVWLHQWTAREAPAVVDGNACMDPTKWNTYAIPEDEMSAAEVKTITDAIAALSAKVDTLTNKVDQKANGVDVKATLAAVNTGHTDEMAKLEELAGRVDGISDAVLEQVDASLDGIEITARYVRQQKEVG